MSAPKRNLQRWNRESLNYQVVVIADSHAEAKDQHMLVDLVADLRTQGIAVPFARLGQRFGDGVTAAAVEQHISKLKAKLKKEGDDAFPVGVNFGFGEWVQVKKQKNNGVISVKSPLERKAERLAAKRKRGRVVTPTDVDDGSEDDEDETKPLTRLQKTRVERGTAVAKKS